MIAFAVNLYGVLKKISLNGLINCSFRKQGRECQPNIAYYLGGNAQAIASGTKIVSLDQYPPPNLVIESGDTSLEDDLKRKKQLYEQLQVAEYWIVDVKQSKLAAFAIANKRQSAESNVLPKLKMSVLEEALRRSRTSDQTNVGAWLLEFQHSD